MCAFIRDNTVDIQFMSWSPPVLETGILSRAPVKHMLNLVCPVKTYTEENPTASTESSSSSDDPCVSAAIDDDDGDDVAQLNVATTCNDGKDINV